MRTNIHLDDELLARARGYSTTRSKRALVHEALATYVTVKEAAQKRERYAARLAELEKRFPRIRVKTPALEIIRADRERRS